MRPHTRTLNLISRIFMMIATVISLVARTTPTHVQAASPQALPAIAPARAPNAPNANPGIQFKLVYNPATAVYEVYMKPDTTLIQTYQINYSQVTIKAPVGFTVSAGPTATAGVNWVNPSNIRTAQTGLLNDYISFEPTSPPNNTPTWTANTEVMMFTFSTATCLSGGATLINNVSDPLISNPNYNPGNSIVIDPSYGEIYDSNYADASGSLVASCSSPDVTTAIGQPTPALVAGATSNLPVTITNSGSGAALGFITTTVTLPGGISAPASFNNNGWVCSTSGQMVTCANLGPINAGNSSGFSVPVLTGVSAVGTQPVFNATTLPVAGEQNTANNAATPLTTTPPASSGTAPVISTPANGSTTNDTTPTVIGNADPNSIVTVYRAGSPICTATTDASGNWNCTPLTALPQGATTITATSVLGSVTSPTATRNFTIDATAPAMPVILAPTDGQKTNDNTPTLTGTGEPVSVITVTESGSPVCSATVTAGGTWSCTAPALSDGPHTVLATATDPAGNTSQAAVRNFTVDTVAPNVPVIDVPTANAVISTTTPAISGQAEPGSTVTVKEGANTVCTATTDGGGNWTCTPTTALTVGVHNVTATATDGAGNTSPATAVRPFTIDTAVPGAPNISAPTAGSTSSNSTPTISGSAEPGATVTVKEGGVTLCTAIANGSGVWSCISSPLTNGPHSITATATDPAGNTSPASTAVSFTVSNTAPAITAPAANSVVSTTNPLFSGTGAANSTVVVKEGATTLCTTLSDASGNWSCASTSALAQGAHSVTATVTDGSGNALTSPADPFTVDSLAPSAPSIATPAASSTTKDNTPTISGSSEPNAKISVSEGGVVLCSATANASGVWSCDPTTSLAEGPHAISVTATDAAGNVSTPATRAFTVDTVAPIAPVVTSPTPGDVISDTTPTVTGTGEPGATVSVRDGTAGPVICTAVVDASGNWSCTPTTPLTDSPHTLGVTQVDPSGNVSPVTNVPVTVDSGVPLAPTIVNPIAASRTNDNTPTVSGTAEPNAAIKVTENGVTLCTATANASGVWSCDSSTLTDGAHTISATQTDAGGNTSPAATRSFTVDATAPVAPVISQPTDGQKTNDNTPTFTGTAEPGSTVTVKDGPTTLCTAVADASGNWSCTPTTPLTEGPHTITATATDPAGNISPASPVRTFTVDSVAPVAPTISAPAAGSTTSDSTPTLSGSAEPNSNVTVKEGTTTVCTVVADASGNWSCDATAALSNGSHTVTATSTDVAGNISPAASRQFSISNTGAAITAPTTSSVLSDTTPTFTGTGTPGGQVTVTTSPTGTVLCTGTVDASGNWNCTPTTVLPEGLTTVVAKVADPGGSTTTSPLSFTVDSVPPGTPVISLPAANSKTSDNTHPISGSAEPNSTVKVTENGVLLCTATTNTSGNWSCTPNLPMAEGTHTISATATDAGGNVSPATTRNFTVDTQAPVAPVVSTPAVGSVSPSTQPVIGGTGEPGATITVKEGPNTLCTATVDVNGNWGCTPTTALAEGPHTLSLTQIDPAGNISPPTTRSFTVDTTAPSAPAISQPTQNAIVSNSNTPALVGTSEPNAKVVVKEGSTTICTTMADAGGNWSCAPNAPLSQGAHAITATATDVGGTTGAPSAVRNFTIDTVAPAAPVISTPASGSTTSDNTPTVTGTSEPNSTVNVSENGTLLCTATTDTSGSWSCEVSTPLSNGPHVLQATATDAGGNTGPSASRPFNVSNTTPTISIPSTGSVVSDTTPTFTGTGTPGGLVTVTTSPTGTVLCTGTVDGNGNWSCTPTTALPEGPTTAVAQIGNPGGTLTTNPVSFTVDSTAPVAPVITAPAANGKTNDNTPQISGTSEPSATVKVSENRVLICTAQADASGNWSCSPSLPMADGPHTVSVTATDAGGNTSPAATRPFTVDTVAPLAPTVSTPTLGGSTNDTTPTVTGTGEPGAAVTATTSPTGTVVCTATVDATGNWSCTPTTPLLEGPNTLSVVQVDPAGNISPPVIRPFTVDTSVPVAPVIVAPTQSALLTVQNPTFSGTSEPNATVVVKEGTTVLCTTQADVSGNWTCVVNVSMSFGNHTVTATQTDLAGNTGPATTGRLFSISSSSNLDSDGDGVPDAVECATANPCRDSDGDGTPDYLDPDDDGDGLLTMCSTPGLNQECNADQDGDGIPAYLDPNDSQGQKNGGDSDGDGIPDKVECPNGVPCPDSDGDGVPDYRDSDSDNDGVPDKTECGTGLPCTDTDGDGKPNFRDLDDDGDGIVTHCPIASTNQECSADQDGDGIPAYLDPNDDKQQPSGGDSDSDGIPDNVECSTGNPCPDTDKDGKPDYMDPDSDGDGILDKTECATGVPCTDTDKDGVPDYREPNNRDTDGDGKTDNNDLDDDGDGIPTFCYTPGINQECMADQDGDGIPAYLDPNDSQKQPNGGDSDSDGIPDNVECETGAPCPDTDGDGVPDYRDSDSDNDGVPDKTECPNGLACRDTDHDGKPDFRDVDDDGDGLNTKCPTAGINQECLADEDKDGIPAYLDPNDNQKQPNGGDADGDGIPDSVECPVGATCPDTDGDGTPDYADLDSDNDGLSDKSECPVATACTDTDNDGLPDYREPNNRDTDGDGKPNNADPDDDGDGKLTRCPTPGTNQECMADEDKDGIPAYLDPNDDKKQTMGGDGDGDGKPDYVDSDSDNDGVPDSAECANGLPCTDTDGDGKPDYRDNDDDGDGMLTRCPTAGANQECNADEDGDGVPAYLDPNDHLKLPNGGDSDNDGIPDNVECAGGGLCPDTDRDGKPDYLDNDSDADGIPDRNECATGVPCMDTDGDGLPDYREPNNRDTDGDGKPDNADSDDDGDGIVTRCPIPGTGQECNSDQDNDGIPAYLDPNDSQKLPNGGDGDGDGVPDSVECPYGAPCRDTDGDGKPDYLDGDDDGDGIATHCPVTGANQECSEDPNGNGVPAYLDPNDKGSAKPTINPINGNPIFTPNGLVTLGGTAAPNSTVNVTEGGQPVCTATTNAAGVWTCNASLAPGQHTLIATDANNAASDPTLVDLTVGTKYYVPIMKVSS